MYLDRIVATKHKEVEVLAQTFQMDDALKKIEALPHTRGFERALSERRNRKLGLIAEVKKASPSKGLIRPDFHPVEIASAYERAGADCISVLTDVSYFQGNSEYLQAIHQAVNIPLLRKDFIIDERQIAEARLLGADAVLLIASILTPEQMRQYLTFAKSLGLDALIEVHDRSELEQVLDIPQATLVGINNRNLKTFETSLNTTLDLMDLIPDGVTLISESGIDGPQPLESLIEAGVHGILVGEHLMRKDDVEAAVYELMGPKA
ncbi:indole-3-glycerol phosphate synthase TrpC [Paenibacillus sp. UMB7766-LJ446]|uniref:indole-3-glycerol phosphate synthase TrpC n=1 Tax=Paenibacillus sp. UMB7766-LJ446 TaxID=3046313 RepID=UPI00254CB86C|nr:indole-3-glycerol phosphate synthase TrpC [Paenibacillus sp. UMB7766-LJ446]MDK8194348.1 indole-3-glycerol phosphate synthase TrpC [Paenibacillus sp. UMB7766-LJ446]